MKRLLLTLSVCASLAAPAFASEEIGRQEDTASADAHVLMPIGCARQDTISSLTSADGDYGLIKCNNVGRLYTSGAIDTALPAGTNAIGKLAPNSGVIIGDVNVVGSLPAGANALGSVTISSGSIAITSQVPGTGATNLGKAEGSTHVNADTGVFSLCVRHDTSTTGLGADGTYGACGLNANGAIYTVNDTEMPSAAALADNTANPTVPGVAAFMMCFDGTTWDRCLPGLSDTDDDSVAFSQVTSLIIGANYLSNGSVWVRELTYLEDAASAGGEQLKLAGLVRQDTPASSTSATGDFTHLKSDVLGLLWTRDLDPCNGVAKAHIAINISTATTTELTPSLAGASTNYYVCSLNLVTAGANNVALADDDTDNCASVTSGLAGGVTAATGWNFGANGTLVVGSGISSVFKTAGTNRVLCLVTSAATQLSGSITVAAAP